MKLPGIILAAGLSSRMGRTKALLPLGESTFLTHLIETFHAVCEPIIVVVGEDAESIVAGLPLHPQVTVVVNENHQLGMLSSLQEGLKALPDASGGAIFTLVDHPRLQTATLAAVANTLEQAAAPVVIPRYHAERGHPVAISAVVMQQLLEAPSNASPKDVIRSHRAETVFVDVDDPSVVEDIDTPDDFDAMAPLA